MGCFEGEGAGWGASGAGAPSAEGYFELYVGVFLSGASVVLFELLSSPTLGATGTATLSAEVGMEFEIACFCWSVLLERWVLNPMLAFCRVLMSYCSTDGVDLGLLFFASVLFWFELTPFYFLGH